MDRLAFSPTEELPCKCFPNYVPGGTDRGRMLLFEDQTCLVEQSADVKMRRLADCSEPSPVAPMHAALPAIHEKSLAYPYNLYAIYKPVYPHFNPYPGSPTFAEQTSPICKIEPNLRASGSVYPYNLYSLYPAIYPYFDLHQLSASRPACLPFRRANLVGNLLSPILAICTLCTQQSILTSICTPHSRHNRATRGELLTRQLGWQRNDWPTLTLSMRSIRHATRSSTSIRPGRPADWLSLRITL